MPVQTDHLTIGQLARRTGIGAKVIRYYEAIGVLPAPPRGANGYRCYDIADVNRLHLLKRIRLLGVPLADAKTLLAEASDARCAEVQQGVLVLIAKRLDAIDQEVAELHQLRAMVQGVQQSIVICPPNTAEPFRACEDMRCIGLMGETAHQEEECCETKSVQ